MFFRNFQRSLARVHSFMQNEVSGISFVSRVLNISDIERLLLGGLKLETKNKDSVVNTFSMRLTKQSNYWKLFKYRPDMDFIPFRDFEISRSSVTQELYREVMRTVEIPQALKGICENSFSGESLVPDDAGGFFGFSGTKYPVYNVSVLHAMLFCNELNRICGYPEPYSFEIDEGYNTEMGESFEFIRFFRRLGTASIRLPTLEEWQYAARCGKSKVRSSNDIWSGTSDPEKLRSYAWTVSNSDLELHEVCQKRPSECGLYDMSGNVYEWTEHFESNYEVSYFGRSFEEGLDALKPGCVLGDSEESKMFLGVGHFYNSTFCWVVGGDIFSYARECVADDVCELGKSMNPLTIYAPCVEGRGFDYINQVQTMPIDRDFEGFDRAAQLIPVFVGFRLAYSTEKEEK